MWGPTMEGFAVVRIVGVVRRVTPTAFLVWASRCAIFVDFGRAALRPEVRRGETVEVWGFLERDANGFYYIRPVRVVHGDREWAYSDDAVEASHEGAASVHAG